MYKFLKFMVLPLMACLALTFTACGDDEEDEPNGGPSYDENFANLSPTEQKVVGKWRCFTNDAMTSYKAYDIRSDKQFIGYYVHDGSVSSTWTGSWVYLSDQNVLGFYSDSYGTDVYYLANVSGDSMQLNEIGDDTKWFFKRVSSIP